MPSQNSSAPPCILIVDDDAGQRSLLNSFLKNQGFVTVTASSGEEALSILDSQTVKMMISDVRMPGISGLETFKRARQRHAVLPVLLVTAYADIRDAVKVMQDGAVNYLQKPIDLNELLASVQRATGIAPTFALEFAEGRTLPESIVARSPLMLDVFKDASLVAPSESRILITGESGVGKEVLADLIHAWSPRAAGPIIKVNCAAIPETLLESELFGHEKGAFTGAFTQRIGRFEEANHGTILLDEIAELSPSVQAKLLRVTQNGRFHRVGSNVEHQTNARLLAATNRDLDKEVEKGTFREDLFFRLNVVELNVPPLRERREDIIPLAQLFANEFSGGRAKLSAAVTRCIEQYEWPGNVRELRNAIERAVLVSRGELILPDHLPNRIRKAVTGVESIEESQASRLEDIEREAIIQALRENAFNRTRTALALGISRRALNYKINRLRQLGFEVDEKPDANP
jgi:two-component system response regulator AtoC